MYRYIILPEAKEELEKEIEYSRKNWGVKHAAKYKKELLSKVRQIAENPKLRPVNPEAGQQIRIVEHKGNRIMYRIDEKRKQVVVVGFPSIYRTH